MKTKVQILMVVVNLLISSTLAAQISFRNIPSQSKVTVKGTSSLHDWEMTSSDMNVEMEMDQNGNELIISGLSFRGDATGLKSGHDLMNNKAYEALKSKQHPEIIFRQSGVKIESFQGNDFKGKVLGKLEIAGVTQNVEIPFSGTVKSDQQVSVSGSVKLRMSNYAMKAPTAMMGTIKTGDEVTLEYQVMMQSDKTLSSLK